jgi:hypothetical protein
MSAAWFFREIGGDGCVEARAAARQAKTPAGKNSLVT